MNSTVAGADTAYAQQTKKLRDEFWARDTDIIYYNGDVDRPYDTFFIDQLQATKRSSNALFILVTSGGNPNAGYRISRCLQDHYKSHSMLISGYCKSTGTLMALGANELIFTGHGELGPLDVQMEKKDELWESQSGLTITSALDGMQNQAFLTFEEYFLMVKTRSQSISTKMASEISTQLTVGLYSELYKNIDPLHIGEATRAVSIARHYGRKLLSHCNNISEESLTKLITGYPSHGFVIDWKEAAELFENVRSANELEEELLNHIGNIACKFPNDGRSDYRFYNQYNLEENIDNEVTNNGDESGQACQAAEQTEGSGRESQSQQRDEGASEKAKRDVKSKTKQNSAKKPAPAP